MSGRTSYHSAIKTSYWTRAQGLPRLRAASKKIAMIQLIKPKPVHIELIEGGRIGDHTLGEELLDELGAETFDVHGIAGHEVPDRLSHDRRAGLVDLQEMFGAGAWPGHTHIRITSQSRC